MKKRILLIGTGGTISSRQHGGGLKPSISAKELLSYVPEAMEFCKAESDQLFYADSTNIQPAHWLDIAACIEKQYDDFDGFVICHGTDTLAYTAAALSYLIQNSRKPIVVTGAQRPIDVESTDGKSNLSDSLFFASCERSHGVVILFDGKVIAGTRGKKERTKSYNAFSSINFPYIATVQDRRVLFYLDGKDDLREPVRFFHSLNSRVSLLKLIPSMGPEILDCMAQNNEAIIIESFGVGGLPSHPDADFHKAVKYWTAAGKTIVMTTQVTNEGSNMSVYEVGKSIKQELELLEAYDMTLEAAVTKLMWILGQTRDKKQIGELFYRTVNRDILWK